MDENSSGIFFSSYLCIVNQTFISLFDGAIIFFLINNLNQSNHVNLFFIQSLEIFILPVCQRCLRQKRNLMQTLAIMMTFALVGLTVYLIYLDRTGRL